MKNLGMVFLGAAIAVVFFLVLQGQPGLAQQPPNYADISSSDFEKIDGIVREILEPLKEGKIDEFEKLLTKNSIPDMEELGDFAECLKEFSETAGKMRDLKYVRHESVKNITDYYVFYYADLRETELFPWSFIFYKVKGEWKINTYRFDLQSPVEFFKFGELQYDSFSE